MIFSYELKFMDASLNGSVMWAEPLYLRTKVTQDNTLRTSKLFI